MNKKVPVFPKQKTCSKCKIKKDIYEFTTKRKGSNLINKQCYLCRKKAHLKPKKCDKEILEKLNSISKEICFMNQKMAKLFDAIKIQNDRHFGIESYQSKLSRKLDVIEDLIRQKKKSKWKLF